MASRGHLLRQALGLLALAAAIAYTVSLVMVLAVSQVDQRRTVDVIVVTGGVGRGDTLSEAIVGRRYLLAHAVPAEAVVAEPEGRTTAASMTAVAAWTRTRRLRRVLLVSDPFHLFRLRLEARRTALEAYTSPTESSPISDNPGLELRFLLREGLKIPVAWARSLW